MEFMFQLFHEETRWDRMTPDEAEREMGAYVAYTQALREAGVFVEGSALAPTSAATTVRIGTDGASTVLDGPYAETKEQLGGYYVIDVPDLDTALTWAARCPTAGHGVVEVRPVRGVPATV
jgi:hypothetical protein